MRAKNLLVVVALGLGAAIFMAPMAQMLLTALKTREEAQVSGPWALPQQPTFDNFSSVLFGADLSFFRFFVNTAVIAILATIGTVATSAMAAFAFARLKFRCRDRMFVLLLATMMLPGVVTIIPSYMLFASVGWVNTNLPLWVPAWLGGGAFNIFLLRQFLMGIPRELDEAAKLDGAGYFTLFWKILLPLTKPALATVGVFTFVGSWSDFLGPLIYLNDREKMTLEMGLRTFQSVQTTQTHLLMAATLVTLLPIVVIFLLGQRYFVRGITLTGGK